MFGEKVAIILWIGKSFLEKHFPLGGLQLGFKY